MHTVYIHLSALIGVFAFANQLVRYAPLDRTILVGAASGVAVYVVLTLGDVIIRRIIDEQGAGEKEREAAASTQAGGAPEKSIKKPAGTEPSAQAA
jgi:hypothetical protein